MQYLRQALLDVYDSDAALKAVLKGMYFIDKPASSGRPFCTITPIDGDNEYTSQNRVEVLLVKFIIEGRTYDSMLPAIDRFNEVFDNAVLNYADSFYTHVSIRRTGFTGPDEHSGVWTYEVDYKIQRVKKRMEVTS